MDKEKTKAKILEKVPLKSKLIMKSTLTEKAELMVGRFGYEDSLLAAGYSDGQVRVFNMNTDNKICQIDTNPSKKQITPVNSLRWRPNNEDLTSINSVLLVANTNGSIFQYVSKTGKELWRSTQEGNFVMAVDYAPNGKSFVTAGKDNIIRIYDQETKAIAHQLSGIKWHTHGHNNRIFSIRFKPDDHNILVSGGWDQNVNIWDIREGNSLATLFGPKIAGDSVDIRENLVLTGANRGHDQLQLWDWKMNKVVTKFRWDQQKQQTNAFLFCAQFCHNSKDTVIAVGGSQMKMFSLVDGSQMLEVKVEEGSSLYSCDSGYTSNKYMVGGNSGTLFYMAGVKSYE